MNKGDLLFWTFAAGVMVFIISCIPGALEVEKQMREERVAKWIVETREVSDARY